MKYTVNKEKCRACKMCSRSRCPAIKITDKAEINKDKCNGCGVCVSLCLTEAIEVYKVH
jgi:TPP-dependent indolepyruvate ferredoxin oxidoreductase alpha subunit